MQTQKPIRSQKFSMILWAACALFWTSAAFAAPEISDRKTTFEIDLGKVQVFSVLLFSEPKLAIVGVHQPATGLAGFARCELSNLGFEACVLNDSDQFLFHQDSMDFLSLALPMNLTASGPTAEQMGFDAGFLKSMGMSSGSIGLLFALRELEAQGSLLSANLQAYYGRLFQVDLNSPPTLDFDSAGGTISPEAFIHALNQSVQNLVKP